MEPAPVPIPADECFRCGYNLFGIADDQACPECGLLAIRSRRVSDELHETRPRWLKSISTGTILILLGILLAAVGPAILMPRWDYSSQGLLSQHFDDFVYMIFSYAAAALVLLSGIFFLTCEEGYGPADRDDWRLRRVLRWDAVFLLLSILLLCLSDFRVSHWSRFGSYAGELVLPGLLVPTLIFLILVALPLPMLLFFQLRGLAKRARSPRLAEHCAIVGIGTSAAIVYAVVAAILMEYGEKWGFGEHWETSSNISLWIGLAVGVCGALFVLWSIYLLVRFAIAFWIAARQRRRNWKRDDRSVTQP